MDIISKVINVLERETYIDKRDGNYFEYEIFVNYDENIGESSLARISRSDNPRETLDDELSEWIFNAEDYYYPELLKTLEKNILEYDEYEEEIRDWLDEHVSWYLPDKVYEQEVDVVISLDTGDCSSDFTECNILNFYGNGILTKDSPIRWLAKQQDKLEEVESALAEEIDQGTDFYDGEEYSDYSNFTRSIIQELQNACSHMNTLIFLVKMPLNEYISLRELVASEERLNNSYTYGNRKGVKSFTIDKNSMCGLYDIWSGGGSVLEIELEKDVTIPTKAIFDIWIDCRGCKANGRGYDVYDVYGLDSSAFTGNIIKIA